MRIVVTNIFPIPEGETDASLQVQTASLIFLDEQDEQFDAVGVPLETLPAGTRVGDSLRFSK